MKYTLYKTDGTPAYEVDIDCPEDASVGIKKGLAVRGLYRQGQRNFSWLDLQDADLRYADLRGVTLRGVIGNAGKYATARAIPTPSPIRLIGCGLAAKTTPCKSGRVLATASYWR